VLRHFLAFIARQDKRFDFGTFADFKSTIDRTGPPDLLAISSSGPQNVNQ